MARRGGARRRADGVAVVFAAYNNDQKNEKAKQHRKFVEEQREPLKTGTKALSTYGTPFLVKPINTLGALGSYNLRREVFADAAAISGEEMHARWPDYGFATHKGYGTPEHLAALREHGPSPWHRRSFAPVRRSVSSS